MTVTIYGTKTCPWCVKAKDYFKSKKITFKDIDVSKDRNAAKEMVDKTGQMGVPVIEINGKFIVGFNQVAIESVLKA